MKRNAEYHKANRNIMKRHAYIKTLCRAWVQSEHPEIYERFHAAAVKKWPSKSDENLGRVISEALEIANDEGKK
jgi:hypothetical protein